ncbi:hypothetical protein D3C74_504150 [compost metagenome]
MFFGSQITADQAQLFKHRFVNSRWHCITSAASAVVCTGSCSRCFPYDTLHDFALTFQHFHRQRL